jgi:hypothetical protein
VLQVAEQTVRRLKAPEVLPAVYAGTVYVDGVKQTNVTPKRRSPPDSISTPLDKTSSCPKDAPKPLSGKIPGCGIQCAALAWHSSWFTGVPKVSELMQGGRQEGDVSFSV